MSNTTKGYYVLMKYSGIQEPYHWVLKAPNHEVILTSENYVSEHGARNGIASTQKNSPFEENYQRLEASDGSFYFNLRAKNYEVIGTSEMYTTKAMRDHGIIVVKEYGSTPYIKDDAGSDNGDIGLAASLAFGHELHAEEKPTITKKPEKSGLAGRYA